jgi:hypothetical protein
MRNERLDVGSLNAPRYCTKIIDKYAIDCYFEESAYFQTIRRAASSFNRRHTMSAVAGAAQGIRKYSYYVRTT